MRGKISLINLEPEQPSIEAIKLPELVEKYVADSRLRAGTQTGNSYDYLLSMLLEWWVEAGPLLNNVLDPRSWGHYERWLSQRRSTQSGEILTKATRQKALNLVKQLLIWAYQQGYLDRDFRDQVPAARGESNTRPGLGVADLRALMLAAGASGNPIRDQTIIAVLLGTGIRRAELAGLNVEHISFHAHGGGMIHITKAKLSKPRYVVFDAICGEYLAGLCDQLGRLYGPLFCGYRDKRLGAKSVYQVVKAAMKRAGIDSRGAGPHDLRRAFATAWLRSRRSLGDGQLLSMQLGHTTEAMSVHYSRPTLDDLQDGFLSPLSLLRDE